MLIVRVLHNLEQQHGLEHLHLLAAVVLMLTLQLKVGTVAVLECVALQTKFVVTTLLFTQVTLLVVLVAPHQSGHGTLVTELVNK
jgi:hypothetical protein